MNDPELIIGGKHHGHWLVADPHMHSVRLACPETVREFASFGMGGPDDCSMKLETYVKTHFRTPNKDFYLWRHEKINDDDVMELLLVNFPKQRFIHV